MIDTLDLPSPGIARVRLLMEALATAAHSASLDHCEGSDTYEALDAIETDTRGYLDALAEAVDADVERARMEADDAALAWAHDGADEDYVAERVFEARAHRMHDAMEALIAARRVGA